MVSRLPFPWLLLVTATQLPSLRSLTKFLPHPELTAPLAIIITAAALWSLLKLPARLERMLHTPWPSVLALVLLAGFITWVYPFVDARKLTGSGSDADDAVIIGATAMWHGISPYGFTTYFGNPLSPGPGWIALASPMAMMGLTPLLTVVALGLMNATLADWRNRSLFTLAFLASPHIWELAASGNDVPALALAITATMHYALGHREPKSLVALALLLGTLCTGRIVFLVFPVLAGFVLLHTTHRQLHLRQALGFGLLTLTVAVAWHVLFESVTPGGLGDYPPLHLLAKGAGIVSPTLRVVAGAVLAATGLVMIRNLRIWHPETHLAMGLAVPFTLLALGDLHASRWSLPLWGGASYLVPALPAIVLVCIPKTAVPDGH